MTLNIYTNRTHKLWLRVKITCRKPSIPIPPEVPITYLAPRFIMAMKAKQMMKTHFPDGPHAAKAAHKAYRDWQLENINLKLLFANKTPLNPAALRWEAFEVALRTWHIAQQDRKILHGHFVHDSVDFSRLD